VHFVAKMLVQRFHLVLKGIGGPLRVPFRLVRICRVKLGNGPMTHALKILGWMIWPSTVLRGVQINEN